MHDCLVWWQIVNPINGNDSWCYNQSSGSNGVVTVRAHTQNLTLQQEKQQLGQAKLTDSSSHSSTDCTGDWAPYIATCLITGKKF